MVLFKSCPRCTGDRILERDFYGWYVVCLACGFVTYPEVDMDDTPSMAEAQRTA